jgi:hypothetical protein
LISVFEQPNNPLIIKTTIKVMKWDFFMWYFL